MVMTVVNIMLPRLAVLKKYCLSTKLHFVWYSYLCFAINYSQAFHYLMTSLPDQNFSHSNDFILYYTYLSNERFLKNELGFFSRSQNETISSNLGVTFNKSLKYFFLTIFSHSCFDLVFMILIYKYLSTLLIGRLSEPKL